jgi:hypothetical protein
MQVEAVISIKQLNESSLPGIKFAHVHDEGYPVFV